jgi:hypothetical protein
MVYCDIVVGSLKFKYDGTRSEYNGDRMDIDIQTYRIKQLIRGYRAAIKYDKACIESYNISLNPFNNDQILSANGKKNQLMDQIISEAIVHFTTCVWEEKEQKIARDIMGDLSGENGRRKPHETLIQDSRRR